MYVVLLNLPINSQITYVLHFSRTAYKAKKSPIENNRDFVGKISLCHKSIVPSFFVNAKNNSYT